MAKKSPHLQILHKKVNGCLIQSEPKTEGDFTHYRSKIKHADSDSSNDLERNMRILKDSGRTEKTALLDKNSKLIKAEELTEQLYAEIYKLIVDSGEIQDISNQCKHLYCLMKQS